jgi:hypothetical protein
MRLPEILLKTEWVLNDKSVCCSFFVGLYDWFFQGFPCFSRAALFSRIIFSSGFYDQRHETFRQNIPECQGFQRYTASSC